MATRIGYLLPFLALVGCATAGVRSEAVSSSAEDDGPRALPVIGQVRIDAPECRGSADIAFVIKDGAGWEPMAFDESDIELKGSSGFEHVDVGESILRLAIVLPFRMSSYAVLLNAGVRHGGMASDDPDTTFGPVTDGEEAASGNGRWASVGYAKTTPIGIRVGRLLVRELYYDTDPRAPLTGALYLFMKGEWNAEDDRIMSAAFEDMAAARLYELHCD